MKPPGFRGLALLVFHHDLGRQLVKPPLGGGEAPARVQRINPQDAARKVYEAGFLHRESEERLKKTVKIKGEKHKLYCVLSSITEADLGD